MCGIAGILDLKGINIDELNNMSSVLRHRGPDDEGFLIYNSDKSFLNLKGKDTIKDLNHLDLISELSQPSNAILGFLHRRLSILDLSPAGHQPMAYCNNKYHLVYNGEVYNYKEIKKELSDNGFNFVSETDSEVILAAYQKWGNKCVEKFVGMWAFALLDCEKQIVFLSRDRFGIKPLYYFESGKKIAFASEIKALLALNFIEAKADFNSILEYISYGSMPHRETTLFKQVKSLLPAHNLIINLNDFSTKTEVYYQLEEKVNNYLLPPEREIQATFNSLLNHSVAIHLQSDVTVGSTLSGGLDSSTIVSIAASKMQGQDFKTFTAAYQEKDIDESHFAQKVANRYSNIKALYIYPSIKSYWEDFEKLSTHQDLPINSTSMFAQWEVMKLAKQQNTKVLLDGQGADEILGGYYNFAGLYLVELLKHMRPAAFIKEKKALKNNFAPNINNAIARSLYYYMPEFMQRKLRKSQRLGMHFIAPEYNENLSKLQVPERGGKTMKDQSFLSIKYGLQDLLRYEDRNSMAFSIESRVPFLDHRLVEFSIALNNDWKIKNGWTKYILRKAAEPLMDKEVVWRKYKMGFLTPQKIWKEQSKKELNTFVNEIQVPEFLNKKYILNLNSTELNDSSHLSEFWKIVSFLKWTQVFKVTF